ncbi:hypothetical protein BCR34DRAFT_497632, partial [Clohesyomyces aquaticus]
IHPPSSIMAPAVSSRAEVRIKAKADDVWAKLIDTSTWSAWNTFVPQAEPIDENDDPKIFKLGTRRRFTAKIHGRSFLLIQKVVEFTTPNDPGIVSKVYRISWAVQGYPHFAFNTLRFNEIEQIETDDGPECVYRTGEDQYGPIAYIVKPIFGSAVEKGLNDWANDLKKAVETQTALNDAAPTQ